MRKGMWVLKCIVMVALMVAVSGLVTQYLWNWLVPEIFNGHVITFGQAIGLLVLTKILLWPFGKSFRGHRGEGPWRHYWKQKWGKMTPEQRDELKRKMRDRWCSPDRNMGSGEENAAHD